MCCFWGTPFEGDGRSVKAEFVFRDEKILRPFFANFHAPGGLKVTRNHHEKLQQFMNKDVVFGIRPEDIEEWKGEKSASHRKLECKVDVIEPMGNEVFVYLSVMYVSV